MLPSRMFWRLFGLYTILLVTGVSLVGAVIVQQEGLADFHRLVWPTAGITVLAALGLAFWLTRRTALRLQEVTAGAERIAGGAYGHKVYVTGADEIAALARTFHYMSHPLAPPFPQLHPHPQPPPPALPGP